MYLYQSELPYHAEKFDGVGYRVFYLVKNHSCLGIGVYTIPGTPYKVGAGIRLPAVATARNLFAWAIAGAESKFFDAVVCTGPDDSAHCLQGDQCDGGSCYQFSLP